MGCEFDGDNHEELLMMIETLSTSSEAGFIPYKHARSTTQATTYSSTFNPLSHSDIILCSPVAEEGAEPYLWKQSSTSFSFHKL